MSSRAAVLFECDFHDKSGRLVARDAIAVVIELDRPVQLKSAHIRRVAAALVSCAAVRRQLDIRIEQRQAAVARETVSAARAIEQRLERILGAIDSQQNAPVQASLFDKRAERQARHSKATQAQMREHIDRRLEAAMALRAIEPSAPRLIAVWPLDDR